MNSVNVKHLVVKGMRQRCVRRLRAEVDCQAIATAYELVNGRILDTLGVGWPLLKTEGHGISFSLSIWDQLKGENMREKKETFKAYITRYSLTTGIKESTVEWCESSPKMVQEKDTSYPTYYHGKDWHRTREEAVARAKEMRDKKIASMKKKIKQLEVMDF